MQLTRYTDYGLRVLMFLAIQPQDRLSSIDEVSELYDISRNHVNKIIHQLGKAGIIITKRGKGGGFHLAKPADAINLGQTVRLLEGEIRLIDCNSPPCKIVGCCQLHGILADAMRAFFAVLDSYTLKDLVNSADNLQASLGLTAVSPLA